MALEAGMKNEVIDFILLKVIKYYNTKMEAFLKFKFFKKKYGIFMSGLKNSEVRARLLTYCCLKWVGFIDFFLARSSSFRWLTLIKLLAD